MLLKIIKSHVEDDSAKLVVNTDASVEIPEVEKISAISVTAAEVTQELLDRITNASSQRQNFIPWIVIM